MSYLMLVVERCRNIAQFYCENMNVSDESEDLCYFIIW